jgi:hypothetical protein
MSRVSWDILQCPLAKRCRARWDRLEPVQGDPAIRFCATCERSVYLCQTDEELHATPQRSADARGRTTIKKVATGPSNNEASHQPSPDLPLDWASPALINDSVPQPIPTVLTESGSMLAPSCHSHRFACSSPESSSGRSIFSSSAAQPRWAGLGVLQSRSPQNGQGDLPPKRPQRALTVSRKGSSWSRQAR